MVKPLVQREHAVARALVYTDLSQVLRLLALPPRTASRPGNATAHAPVQVHILSLLNHIFTVPVSCSDKRRYANTWECVVAACSVSKEHAVHICSPGANSPRVLRVAPFRCLYGGPVAS